MGERILRKHPANPILTPRHMPRDVLYVFNPGAVRHGDETLLMMDVTTLDDIHRLWLARSRDGVHFVPDPEPIAWPEPDPIHPETCAYDPRITRMGDDCYILYASDLSQNDVRIGIVRTRDFARFERVCIASELGNRNGALFPEKIGGLYARLDRPFGNELNPCYMWLSSSPDLVFWGQSRPLTRNGRPFHDGHKMGAGAVPIRTGRGWLEIYHTVSTTCNGFIYRLKAMLLDLQDPWRVIGHTRDFILWPEHDYEMRGRVMNVVFTCNALLDADGTVRIYYGAADTCIGLAEGRLDDILDACRP
jgi:beta-1,4-mannooligosaccharide/beta-1,4-mannosyl-N-acetylglucosamine phosphorylase